MFVHIMTTGTNSEWARICLLNTRRASDRITVFSTQFYDTTACISLGNRPTVSRDVTGDRQRNEEPVSRDRCLHTERDSMGEGEEWYLKVVNVSSMLGNPSQSDSYED